MTEDISASPRQFILGLAKFWAASQPVDPLPEYLDSGYAHALLHHTVESLDLTQLSLSHLSLHDSFYSTSIQQFATLAWHWSNVGLKYQLAVDIPLKVVEHSWHGGALIRKFVYECKLAVVGVLDPELADMVRDPTSISGLEYTRAAV